MGTYDTWTSAAHHAKHRTARSSQGSRSSSSPCANKQALPEEDKVGALTSTITSPQLLTLEDTCLDHISLVCLQKASCGFHWFPFSSHENNRLPLTLDASETNAPLVMSAESRLEGRFLPSRLEPTWRDESASTSLSPTTSCRGAAVAVSLIPSQVGLEGQ